MVGDGVPYTDLIQFVGENTKTKVGVPNSKRTRLPIRLSIQGQAAQPERLFLGVGTAQFISNLIETRMLEVFASTQHKTVTWHKRKLRRTQLC